MANDLDDECSRLHQAPVMALRQCYAEAYGECPTRTGNKNLALPPHPLALQALAQEPSTWNRNLNRDAARGNGWRGYEGWLTSANADHLREHQPARHIARTNVRARSSRFRCSSGLKSEPSQIIRTTGRVTHRITVTAKAFDVPMAQVMKKQ
jgi:hypothetical protein